VCAGLFVFQTWLASLFFVGRTSLPPGDATNAAFYNVAASFGGYWLKFILAVPGIFLASIAGAVTAQAATARLLYGMARDGKMPAILAEVHPKRKVPVHATTLVAAITLVLGLAFVNQLALLASMVSFGALIGFILLHLSVIAHFRRQKVKPSWFRRSVAPVAGLIIIAAVLWSISTVAQVTGGSWLGVGLIALTIVKWRERRGDVENLRT
jgi:amino acid transporter